MLSDLLQRYDVEYAYLFGSRARGEQTEMSDTDVAVWFRAGLSTLDRFDRVSDLKPLLEAEFGTPVDLVALNDAGPVLQHEAALRGKLLYPQDPVLALDLERRLRQRFEDYAYSQRFFTEERQRRLGIP